MDVSKKPAFNFHLYAPMRGDISFQGQFLDINNYSKTMTLPHAQCFLQILATRSLYGPTKLIHGLF